MLLIMISHNVKFLISNLCRENKKNRFKSCTRLYVWLIWWLPPALCQCEGSVGSQGVKGSAARRHVLCGLLGFHCRDLTRWVATDSHRQGKHCLLANSTCVQKCVAATVNICFSSFPSPQSLKEGLTAEQRLHLFENKDTKEFWQWHLTSADLAACLEAHYILAL